MRKKWGHLLSDALRDDGGQVIVEYIIMLSLAIGVVAIMARAFKGTIIGLWKTFAKEISAACPKCPPTQSF